MATRHQERANSLDNVRDGTRGDAQGPAGSVEARIARLDRLAKALDSRFRIPGTSIRFGWDSILGLVPGLGGAVTFVPAVMQIVEGRRLGARRSTLIRMAVNSGLDFFIGGVPIAGDVFDVFFKANRKNLELLKADLLLSTQDERVVSAAKSRGR